MGDTDNLTAVLHCTDDIRLEQLPVPQPGSDQVLLKMDSVGICGSDVHYWTHGAIGDFVVRAPMVLGHEAAGVVVAVGTNVDSLQVSHSTNDKYLFQFYFFSYLISYHIKLFNSLRTILSSGVLLVTQSIHINVCRLATGWRSSPACPAGAAMSAKAALTTSVPRCRLKPHCSPILLYSFVLTLCSFVRHRQWTVICAGTTLTLRTSATSCRPT